MNIEGPSLRDILEYGIYALRQRTAPLSGKPLPAAREAHNAADLIEDGEHAPHRHLDRDVAA